MCLCPPFAPYFRVRSLYLTKHKNVLNGKMGRFPIKVELGPSAMIDRDNERCSLRHHSRYPPVENGKIATNMANFIGRYSMFATEQGILLALLTLIGNKERHSATAKGIPNASPTQTDVKWNMALP